MPNVPDLLPTREVAAIYGCDVRTVHRMVARGDLIPAIKAPGPKGALLFRRDDVFAAALAAGAGEIEAALMQGQRYTAAQLTALTGNSAAMLQRINARLALRILWQRRPWVEDQGRIASFEEADKILRDLATGKIVFDIDDHKSASVPTITGPSTATVQRLQGIATQARGNFYPAMRLPYGR